MYDTSNMKLLHTIETSPKLLVGRYKYTETRTIFADIYYFGILTSFSCPPGVNAAPAASDYGLLFDAIKLDAVNVTTRPC
ncbi:unnamed protein product [Tuber aestivum]|uniref:Uncharacterized protein n=1 Tax=Tuber aestivum TaxID=59557 RepID=A0A292PML4_9PEZI|nr:unnamed protein product [Tuber aestivum]